MVDNGQTGSIDRDPFIHRAHSGYTRQPFTVDLFVSLLVGVVALSLSMALAVASGGTPEQGLWMMKVLHRLALWRYSISFANARISIIRIE